MRFQIQSPLGENNLCLHCTPVFEINATHTKARASSECIKVKQFILDFVSYSARPARINRNCALNISYYPTKNVESNSRFFHYGHGPRRGLLLLLLLLPDLLSRQYDPIPILHRLPVVDRFLLQSLPVSHLLNYTVAHALSLPLPVVIIIWAANRMRGGFEKRIFNHHRVGWGMKQK